MSVGHVGDAIGRALRRRDCSARASLLALVYLILICLCTGLTLRVHQNAVSARGTAFWCTEKLCAVHRQCGRARSGLRSLHICNYTFLYSSILDLYQRICRFLGCAKTGFAGSLFRNAIEIVVDCSGKRLPASLNVGSVPLRVSLVFPQRRFNSCVWWAGRLCVPNSHLKPKDDRLAHTTCSLVAHNTRWGIIAESGPAPPPLNHKEPPWTSASPSTSTACAKR